MIVSFGTITQKLLEHQLDFGRETLVGSVIENPDSQAYQLHRVLVNRVENGIGAMRILTGSAENE